MNLDVSTENEDDDEWLIYDDVNADGTTIERAPEEKPWNILIVDDDLDVHAVTRLALHKVTFKGRPLKFLSAYSRHEAYMVLRDTQDIALVLLDVVMETDDAGLGLARQIREDLNNQMVRVVLRTGQPGQAPEQSVVVEYDINDYKSKTELTSQKLFTTVVSSLRAYESLQLAERGRIELNASVAKIKVLKLALDQHAQVTITDQYGKFTYANEKFCATSKYTLTELLGQDYRIFNSGYHSKEFFSELWRTVEQGNTWQGEIRNRAKDNSTYWVDTTLVPFPTAEGQANQYVAIHTDITERKLAQEHLQSSEASMRHLLEISPIAVSITRVCDRNIMFVNQCFIKMLNTTLEQVENGDPIQFYQKTHDYYDIVERLSQGQTIVNQPLDLLTFDQQKIPVLASYSALTYQGEAAVLIWFYDMTAWGSKRAAQEHPSVAQSK